MLYIIVCYWFRLLFPIFDFTHHISFIISSYKVYSTHIHQVQFMVM